MAISRRARFIRWLSGRYIRGIDLANAPVTLMRKRLDQLGRLARAARHVAVEKKPVAGLHAEWYRPAGAQPGKLLLYLHGGAYTLGSCDSHRKLVTHMAKEGNIDAVMPEYRLAPEYPFPAGLDDALAVYKELLESGYNAADIIISGDSAGGGLSVATMLQLRHEGLPLPGAAILLSPFLDMSASGETMKTRADRDPWFRPDEIEVVVSYYCPNEDVRNPLLSPVFANVAGLPPTMIQVGDDEILLSDSTRFADKLRTADVDVAIEVFPEMWHVFQLFVGKMPESKAAVKKIGAYIKERFPAPAQAA
jgi:acetyl esterase/lipase